MTLEQKVYDFIRSPFPPWELELTEMLVQSKLTELNSQGLTKPSDYSTLGALRKDFNSSQADRNLFHGEENESGIYLEHPHSELTGFYDEHGLLLCSEAELESTDATSKLCRAFRVFESVEQRLGQSLQRLIRSIHVLRQDDPEIDTSYTHPAIPFSVFVSVSQENSDLVDIRVAESILHEAMHLKLTLIETAVPLISHDSDELFYSPWREEMRPIHGVLHGLFVFSSVYCFYDILRSSWNETNATTTFVDSRLRDIAAEIAQLKSFSKKRGLTKSGKDLATRLILSCP